MNRKKILEDYKNFINLFKKYNKQYYELSDPKVTDQQYDELKNKIIKLETENEFLKSKYSPSSSVGHKPSKNFNKVLHRAPMLSLSNAFTENDLINFEKKNIKFSI